MLGGLTPVVFLLGPVAVVLGAGLTSPWALEQLGRLARFLPAGPRLAVRDAARFRSRNGPIVTAEMAGQGAASVTVVTLLTSMDAAEQAGYVPELPDDVLVVETAGIVGAGDAVARAVGTTAYALSYLDVAAESQPEGTGSGESARIADPELIGHLLGPDAETAARGGAVISYAGDAPEQVVLRGRTDDGELGEVIATLPVHHVLESQGTDVSIRVERGHQNSYDELRLGATAIGGMAGLLIAAVAIALAAAESRADLRTLAAVGAGRRTRTSLAASRALLLAGLNGVLAIPVGLVPAASLLTIVEGGIPLSLPWPTLASIALGVPALACLGAVSPTLRDRDGFTLGRLTTRRAASPAEAFQPNAPQAAP
jgi:hypothetical protein